MKITFEPAICQPSTNEETGVVTPPAYSGTVTMRMPDYDERIEMYEHREDGGKGLKFTRFVAKNYAAKYVEAVALKRLDDGYEFSSWESLQYDGDMGAVISEIVGKLIGKFQVGKNSTPT